MTEKINKALRCHFGNFDYKLSNSYIFPWESDFFAISTSGYCYEVEIKVSRADFRADFKKTEKHYLLKNSKKDLVVIPGRINIHQDENSYCKEIFENQRITIAKSIVPNRFYYACPEGLIKPEEIPEYAGLFYFDEDRFPMSCLSEVKKAKYLSKRKHLKDFWFVKTLMKKFYYRSIDLQIGINELKSDIRRYDLYYHKEDQKTTLF